jgi:hypothetical protein
MNDSKKEMNVTPETGVNATKKWVFNKNHFTVTENGKSHTFKNFEVTIGDEAIAFEYFNKDILKYETIKEFRSKEKIDSFVNVIMEARKEIFGKIE